MRQVVMLAAAPAVMGILDHFGQYAWLAVFAFVVVENFGAPIPGETMLVAASAYAATPAGRLNIALVVIFCIGGVWLGSTLSYLAGRRGGVALLRRLHVPHQHLARAQAYMARWGSHTVFFGRYVAFLRSYVGWLAGINRMAVGPFLLWNLAGATVWTLTFATLGYVLGRNWALIERIFKVLGYGGGALVAAAVIAYLVYRHRRLARAPAPAEDTDADASRDALSSGQHRP
jgi:membrane protein DedA with SNARE-associated domain